MTRVLLLALISLTIQGCAFDFAPLHGHHDSGQILGDGGMPFGDGGGEDGGILSDAGTGLAHAPERPTVADDALPGDVAFGLMNVELQHSNPSSFGLDLDGRWTTSSNPDSECTVAATPPSDGNNGVDDQFEAAVAPLVNAIVPGVQNQVRTEEAAGRSFPVLRLRGWNQTPNDPQIEVSVAASVFSAGVVSSSPPVITINSPTDYHMGDGSAVPDPVWDGNDWTWLREDDFMSGDPNIPVFSDPHAYISDGTLVITLLELDLPLMIGGMSGIPLRLHGVQIVARLTADGHLDSAILVGRWSVNDFMTFASDVGVCSGTSSYDVLHNQVTRYSDVRSTIPSTGDPTLPCDAISVTIGFTGYRTQIGGVTPGISIVPVCT